MPPHIIDRLGNTIIMREEGEIRRAQRLATYAWPRDRNKLWHLPWFDFLGWLYAMNPREALIMSNDADFAAFREKKRNKEPWQHAVSWVWRKIWD